MFIRNQMYQAALDLKVVFTFEISHFFPVSIVIFSCRDPSADGQATAAKVRPVPDLGTPHGGAADGTEVSGRNLTAAIRDQSNSGGARSHGGCLRRR